MSVHTAIAVAALCVAASGHLAMVVAQQRAPVPAALTQRAQTEGTIHVIVRLALPTQPEGQLSSQATETQRRSIAEITDRALRALIGTTYRVTREFETIPFVALEVGPDALAALAQSPNVTAVVEDRLSRIALAQSVPLVEAPAAWNLGYDGTGWSVAVIDTGVDGNHPWLLGKVVSEACFSANSSCPNGKAEQLGVGAGVHCTYADLNCTHGTHVAGIAAGATGVAKGASVISIQVFSRFSGPFDCAGTGDDPCARSFTSDQLKGLEHVYQLRTSFNIAAVNISLADPPYPTQEACDADYSATKMLIDNFRSAGIATVISSGDDAYAGGLSAPACISSAVSVGSTTKSDTVSTFSNSAPFLSLLAPGENITSSIPGVSPYVFPLPYAPKSGTSMAAPHVAGAWAIFKQFSPSASVSTILDALRNSGLSIVDPRNQVATPRIRIFQALNNFHVRHVSISDVRLFEGQSGTRDAVFTVSLDGINDFGVSVNYQTTNVSATATSFGNSYANSSSIVIPESGSAAPYPSSISVPSGLGSIARLAVELRGFTHGYPKDVDVLLVGPTGQTVVLMSDPGSADFFSGVNNLLLRFDDNAQPLPESGTLVSGTFRPTNIAQPSDADVFPSPAPAGPWGSLLAGFNGTNPAGMWQLFVRDDTWPDGGSFSGGWALDISTASGDYVATSGSLTFPKDAATSASRTISVPVNGDTTVEPTETFSVVLSSAVGANIIDGIGTATIVNDDFTDSSLTGVSMKAAHVIELREGINEARLARELPPFAFTDPVLTAQSTLVRAVHIIEMRAALAAAYSAAGLSSPTYTDSTITPGTVVRGVHIQELRTALTNLP